jgi:hypothetical protein
MRKQPLDPVVADEIRHDRDLEHAQELVAAQIDEMMDTVWDEVADGEHDRELTQSSWIDTTTLARIARIAACNSPAKIQFGPAIPAHDLNDLYLQITDYVRDVAEMRVTR